MGGWSGVRRIGLNTTQFHRRRQKAVVFVGLMLFGLLFFMIQIWLFVAVLENVLAGHAAVAVPAAIASIVVFVANLWMLRGLTLVSKSL